MRNRSLILFAALLPLFIIPATTKAQKTAIYDNPLALYRTASELLNKEKFGSAQEFFLRVANAVNTRPSELKTYSEYYADLCAIELFHKNAEYLAWNFIVNNPENPKVNDLWFALAKLQFRNKNYERALACYDQIDASSLSADESAELHFKRGYCYFLNNDIENAKKEFFAIKDQENDYQAPANYYYGHIAYSEKNYQTALLHFNRLLTDESYGKIVPYYITQVYYVQEKYDDLIKVAVPLLDSASTKRAPEIAHMIGDAYYRTNRYLDALDYYEIFLQKTQNTISRSDYYVLGYSSYHEKKYEKAIGYFNRVNTDSSDLMTQSTWYHLADCYLRTDQKQFALNSFHSASTFDFDKEMQENAMFNYAKLMYETAFNPYNQAVITFQEYIAKYPQSAHLDEAYEYLSDLYISTKNYKDALASLESIKKRDPKLNAAYQKVAYFCGLELFNNSKYDTAIMHFDKSLKVASDQSISALCTYWRGEAYYRLEDYDNALKDYLEFQKMPGAFSQPEFIMSNYNIGYCQFKNKNYKDAVGSFRKYISDTKKDNHEVLNDAYLRAADCYFMGKDFTNAIDFYDKALILKLRDTDYALFQKSLAQGALGRFEGKAATLAELTTNYKSSAYYDDAIFELANTYQHMGNSAQAILNFDLVISEFPNSSYVSRALLKEGLIYYNEGKDDLSLQKLKKVVTDFPGTNDSKEALVTIRNVYVDMDKVEEFFLYVKELPFANVSDAAQDSITYIAVENRYMNNDCENSIKGFNNYIGKFQNGIFLTDAHFYLADCQYRGGNITDALANYKFVNAKPKCKYTETSVLNSSEICYTQKNYAEALELYSRLNDIAEYKSNTLIALTGMMRCNYNLQKYTDAIAGARLLLAGDKLSEELIAEAHITIARSALLIDSIALAQTEFGIVAKTSKSEMGAESKYNLAAIQYKLGMYSESEKACFDLINQVPSYDYWVAKSFILLADNYLAVGNNKQAKSTLQSIIENYEGADLILIAQEKLNSIIEKEKLDEQKKAEDLIKSQQQEEIKPENFDQK
ncbi:MAG: tetratricopeptide repeat protein [Bacteroidota bacterium]